MCILVSCDFITCKWSFLHCTDIPLPVGVSAEATTDNTSIRVSWGWSRQGVPKCVNLVRVHYQPEGGSVMMYTVGSTTVTTSGTLVNLQCNKVYSIWVYAGGGLNDARSAPTMFYLPARGGYMLCNLLYSLL